MSVTSNTINSFINSVAPLIQKYAYKNEYPSCVCSAIIAQACLESMYGTSQLGSKYHNYFGMKCGSSWKGKSVNLSTKEEFSKNTITDIKANFRVYDNMEEGIKGYFDFISKDRYSNLKSVKSDKSFLQTIKNDGYATSSTYVQNNYNVILKYDLKKYNIYENLTKTSKYYSKYSGTSTKIDEVFKAISVPDMYIGNKLKRTPIATKNGIDNYSGTAEQNLKLISLAKKGTLLKP